MGQFTVKVVREGEVVADLVCPNQWLTAASDLLLDTFFNNTAVPQLYIGLVGDSNFTGFSDSDTMSSHAGWEEFTAYRDFKTKTAARPKVDYWLGSVTRSATKLSQVETAGNLGLSVNQIMRDSADPNSNQILVSVDLPQLINGVFLATDGTLGGTTGTLLATAPMNPVGYAPQPGDYVWILYSHYLTADPREETL